jgi:hypothetical protein
MTKFQHFIITPFNVDIGVKSREYILGTQYLENRLKIFQEVSYPSVYNQSNQNFQWLVFIDKETPTSYQKTFEELSRWLRLSIILTEPNVNFHPLLVEAIKKRLDRDTEFLITSSLDCDDAFHRHYIRFIQENFREQDFEFINFPFGYLLRKDGLFLRQYLSSTFISLIERINDPIITSKVMSHSKVFELFQQGLKLRQIFTEPLWLQTVHDNNLLTKLDVNATLQPLDKVNTNFPIQEFVRSHVESSYSQSLSKFLSNNILKNKYKLPLRKRINNAIALINPALPIFYLWLILNLKSRLSVPPVLSVHEMKLLCLQQPTHWRKTT